MNEDYTWDFQEEENQVANGQRRDAYWVLTNSMPYGTDFNYLQTGIRQGDANALYKKVLKVFRQKSSQNGGKWRAKSVASAAHIASPGPQAHPNRFIK